MLACKNSGYEVLDHFADVRKMIDTDNIFILTIYVLVYNCPSGWVGSNFYTLNKIYLRKNVKKIGHDIN